MASKNKRETIINMLDGKCFYCGCVINIDTFHTDHFVPISLGGRIKNNLVPSCPECNLYKSNLDIEGFRKKLAKDLLDSFHGKLVTKYYLDNTTKTKCIKFYYEEVGFDGFI